jgi:hypothetical protein
MLNIVTGSTGSNTVSGSAVNPAKKPTSPYFVYCGSRIGTRNLNPYEKQKLLQPTHMNDLKTPTEASI